MTGTPVWSTAWLLNLDGQHQAPPPHSPFFSKAPARLHSIYWSWAVWQLNFTGQNLQVSHLWKEQISLILGWTRSRVPGIHTPRPWWALLVMKPANTFLKCVCGVLFWKKQNRKSPLMLSSGNMWCLEASKIWLKKYQHAQGALFGASQSSTNCILWIPRLGV